MKKKTLKKDPVPEPMPAEPINTSMAQTPLERYRSNAVKLTEQIEDIVSSIDHYRELHGYHTREAQDMKERLHTCILNHTELKAQLVSLLAVPNLIV